MVLESYFPATYASTVDDRCWIHPPMYPSMLINLEGDLSARSMAIFALTFGPHHPLSDPVLMDHSIKVKLVQEPLF